MRLSIIFLVLFGLGCPAYSGTVLNMEEAERLLIKNSLDIRAKQLDLQKSEAAVLEAKALSNPSVKFSLESLENGLRETEETFSVTQNLDISGKRGRRIDAARKSREAQGLFLAHEISGIVVQMKHSFYKVLLLRENEKAMAEIAEVISDIERKTEVRVDAGDASESDLMKLQGEKDRIVRVLKALQSELRAEKCRLALLLNVDSTGFEISGEFAYRAMNTGDRVPEESALLSIPELQGQLKRIEAAELEVSAARKETFPTIDLEAGYKKRTGGFHGLVFGVSIPLPLFDRNQGGRSRAEATLVQEKTIYEAMTKAAAAEVDVLRERMASLQNRIADILRDIARSQELTRIAGIAYEEGEMGLLEFLDAARSEKDLVIEKNTAVYDYWSAYFNLEKAMGIQSSFPGGMK